MFFDRHSFKGHTYAGGGLGGHTVIALESNQLRAGTRPFIGLFTVHCVSFSCGFDFLEIGFIFKRVAEARGLQNMKMEEGRDVTIRHNKFIRKLSQGLQVREGQSVFDLLLITFDRARFY